MIDSEVILSVTEALSGYTVDRLKPLLSLLPIADKPKRKAEIITTIDTYVQQNLRHIWQQLDETQQLAVAEVVHSSGFNFNFDRFRAKYGKPVNFGSEYQ